MTDKNDKLQQITGGDQRLSPLVDDLITDAGRGTENIGENDVRPPRILICQSGSPYRKPDDPKQIPGLNELDIFNDLSGDNYHRGPLKFIVLDAMKPRCVEFAPMDEGGGVLDMDVPLNDPRAQFSTDGDGKRQKPVATMFRDFLVYLPDQGEVAVLSMKGSQLKIAVQLNSKTKLPIKGEMIDAALKGRVIADPPAWARTFSVSTVMLRDSAKGYSWGGYTLKLEGLTPPDVRRICRELNEAYAKKNVIVPVEPDDEPTFDPSELEHQPSARVGTTDM